MTMATRGFFESKTVWGGILALLTGVFAIIWKLISPEAPLSFPTAWGFILAGWSVIALRLGINVPIEEIKK